MILDHLSVTKELMNLSRVCGDDPAGTEGNTKVNLFVPRMRGWSHEKEWTNGKIPICPAYAGMIPEYWVQSVHPVGFVPRMRGWSCSVGDLQKPCKICPAYERMILRLLPDNDWYKELSYTCRGDSLGGIAGTSIIHFFLRALSKHTRISGFRSKTHERRERKLSVVESTPPMKLRRNSAAWKQICVRRGKRFNS